MASFSPELMARLRRVTLKDSYFGARREWFQLRGGWTECMAFIREAAKDRSDAGQRFAKNLPEQIPSHWAGTDGESLSSFLETGIFKNASREFQAEAARLSTKHFQPGQLRPAVAGGAWIVPLAINNNPMPARIRDRTKLPAKNLEIAISVSFTVKWEKITQSLANIARAAWNYIQAGGVASITVHYVYAFSKLWDGCSGFVLTVTPQLMNEGLFASACSTQAFRGLIPLAQALSGKPDDDLPVTSLETVTGNPILRIQGSPTADAQARAAFNIA